MFYNLEESEFLVKIKRLLVTVLEVDDIGYVDMNTNLVSYVGTNSLALSSIDYVDFLVCVENEYDIVIDFDLRIYTIRDIYNYILKCKNVKEGEIDE